MPERVADVFEDAADDDRSGSRFGPGRVDDLADLSNPMANLMDVCTNDEFFVIARKGLIQLSAKPS